MKIPVALLADEANISQEGKLNVLGAFDRIAAARFPMLHPRMVFVFRVQAEYADAGERFPTRVRLMDEDGAALFEANGDLVAPPLAPGEFTTANQVFSLVGVRFPRPGHYKFVLNVGSLPPHETPLRVVQAPVGEVQLEENG
jgi:hypothetical protein